MQIKSFKKSLEKSQKFVRFKNLSLGKLKAQTRGAAGC